MRALVVFQGSILPVLAVSRGYVLWLLPVLGVFRGSTIADTASAHSSFGGSVYGYCQSAGSYFARQYWLVPLTLPLLAAPNTACCYSLQYSQCPRIM